MKRTSESQLEVWYDGKRRKPLILRGARQVGKSTLVRNFAKSHGLTLNEVNLERHLHLEKVFASLDVTAIKLELEALLTRTISETDSILFLDEIQATPSALQALRYLYEDMPELAVMAAGSLLEFTLASHNFSMPVGRIDYHHLGPMSFREFLTAIEPGLVSYLDAIQPTTQLPETAHQKLLQRHRQYLFVGGMPEAVLVFAETGSLETVSPVHQRIIDTYEDDFAKYARRDDLALLQRVFRQIPRHVGKKLKYVNYSREHRSREVKRAIDLLTKARVCTAIEASHCSGVPLAAHVHENASKLLYLDVGLMNHVCGMDWLALRSLDDLQLVNEGSIAEQVVGQHLAYLNKGTSSPSLSYWLREGRANNAEVDYVISHGPDLFPIEVKAGKRGSLRSLHQYASEKPCRAAIRLDLNQPSHQYTKHALLTYELLSLPLYAAGEINRIITDYRSETLNKKS